jgi:hypothetical protein
VPPLYRLGRIPHEETPQAAVLYPVTAHPLYSTAVREREWYWEGGAWLDQGDTGTCVANALSHRIADSPNPRAGITENYAQDLYVKATGDFTMDKGTSALTVCRYLKTHGVITAYHWISSADELVNTLLGLGSVCIGIDWFNSMDQLEHRYGNDDAHWYLNVDSSSGVRGGHETLCNGIRLDTVEGEPPFVRIKNSWGRGYANGGTVRMALSDLNTLLFDHGGDAVLISEASA